MAAGWILVPCLVKLRDEFNDLAPHRDKASDGSIGDVAHEERESDHNRDETGNVPIKDADKVQEVHAIDVDTDLRVPDLDMERCVQFTLNRCRTGKENRLRYIIYNRRIWSASNGWRQQKYTGANPHDKHAHFSSSYNTAREADQSTWHLEDLMALSTADKTWLSAEIAKQVKAAIAANNDDLIATDGDPSDRIYSLGGLVSASERRTYQLANKDIPELKADIANIKATVTLLAERLPVEK